MLSHTEKKLQKHLCSGRHWEPRKFHTSMYYTLKPQVNCILGLEFTEQFRGEEYIYPFPSKNNYIPGKVLILLCKEDDLLKSAKNLNRSSSLSLSPSYQEKEKNQYVYNATP